MHKWLLFTHPGVMLANAKWEEQKMRLRMFLTSSEEAQSVMEQISTAATASIFTFADLFPAGELLVKAGFRPSSIGLMIASILTYVQRNIPIPELWLSSFNEFVHKLVDLLCRGRFHLDDVRPDWISHIFAMHLSAALSIGYEEIKERRLSVEDLEAMVMAMGH